ncbi:MAG: polysaccharide pyruvyl transferase family protein [Lachnospiraceae bacterium]|nr:polysaccharide pyruvyl transferase family protein [Lachnospiraceae bacterium]
MRKLFLKYKNGVTRRYEEYCWKNRVKKSAAKEKEYPSSDKLIVFDTAIHSQNMGDVIIQHYCRKVLDEVFAGQQPIRVPTHILPARHDIDSILGAKIKIVCGTNLITPHYEEYSNWEMSDDLFGYQNIITLGVGWGYYCEEISPISRFVYNTILAPQGLHSVRDSYTEQKFREMGILNVVNTGCPTLWGLSRQHCESIPLEKATTVITTITDYDRNVASDRLMLEILLQEYKKVSVWIQGSKDMEYLRELIDVKRVEIIPNDFESYTKALTCTDVDYVGTRLHAGIHALNLGVRSLIVAIDNRAIEMGKDVNLPLIMRENLEQELVVQIRENRKTDIVIPEQEINLWKKQFV